MEITADQYERIQACLPVRRGNVRHGNLVLLNAVLYVAEHGCKWRGLPKRFGNWHSIYMNRWAKKGVLDQVFVKLPQEQILRIKIEAFSLESTSVKVHPDGTGALKKTDRRPSGNRGADGTPGIHLVAANARTAIIFCLSPGEAHDAPVGRQLLLELGPLPIEVSTPELDKALTNRFGSEETISLPSRTSKDSSK